MMDAFVLKPKCPCNLVLAADARSGLTDYVDDQIWELQFMGEPKALLLYTSMGLRAGELRVYPVFHFDDDEIQDPFFFKHHPQVTRIFPSYVCLDCSPFEHLTVSIEIWVPESHAIAARLLLKNTDRRPHRVGMELASTMDSMDKGQPMGLSKLGMNWILGGSSRGVAPVIFMSGGTKPGTGYAPGLLSEFMLASGEEKRITWALAGSNDEFRSLEMARDICNLPWESNIKVLEKVNLDSQLEIRTGKPGWDAALYFSMNATKRLIHHGTTQLLFPTFVLSRNPDQGFSVIGNGSDYGYLWEGPTVLDAWYMMHLLLTVGKTFCKGFIRNFLSTQEESGKLGFRLNVNKTPILHHAQPLLATMTEQVYGNDSTISELQEVFPGLMKYFFYWFSPMMDKDQDGFPEWSHSLQTGLEDMPIFHQAKGEKEDYPSEYLESPALLAMLFSECQCLIHIARKLGKNEVLVELDQVSVKLKGLLESCWDPKLHSYHYLDHITHSWTSGERFCVLQGAKSHRIRRAIKPNSRFIIEFTGKVMNDLFIKIIGRFGQTEISEEISLKDFSLNSKKGIAITRNVFSHIERVIVRGIKDRECVIIKRPDLSQLDISLLLPLWAGMVDDERAKEMVKKGLVPRLESAFGLTMIPLQKNRKLRQRKNYINLPWNTFVIEGLLRYGYQKEAIRLFEKLLRCCETTLKSDQHFFQSYSAITGNGFGVEDHLHGLISADVFFHIIGIKGINEDSSVLVEGRSPFPTPIVVKYKGMTIERFGEAISVVFPNGLKTSAQGTGRTLITNPVQERKETA